MNNRPLILSTKLLSDSEKALAVALGLEIKAHAFIDTRVDISAINQSTLVALQHEKVTMIFTSQHAVNAVAQLLQGIPKQWDIFCINGKTQKTLLQYVNREQIKGSAISAIHLWEVIARFTKDQKLYYCCGNLSLGTLREKLTALQFDFQEVEVYRTIETPYVIDENYNLILFFSPSGVASFVKENAVKPDLPVVAIGKTTERALEKVGFYNIATALEPTLSAMFLIAQQIFQIRK